MKGFAVNCVAIAFILCNLLPVSNALHAEGVQFLYSIPLSSPRGVAVDGSGRVYVRTPSHAIAVMDYNGNVQFRLGKNDPNSEVGNGNGEFFSPIGIDVDTNGRIYVADTGNNRVQVFENSGNFLFKFGTTGSGPGQFNGVMNVAVANNGNIYTTDRYNKRVEIFGPSGDFLSQFAINPSGSSDPFSIAVDSMNKVYVGDLIHDRVRVYNELGAPLFDFGGVDTPEALTVDALGKIYVANSKNMVNAFRVFNPDGQFLFEFDETGNGKFGITRSVAVDPQGLIFVTDDGGLHLFASVPEPSSIALLISVMAAVAFLSQRVRHPAT